MPAKLNKSNKQEKSIFIKRLADLGGLLNAPEDLLQELFKREVEAQNKQQKQLEPVIDWLQNKQKKAMT